MLDKISKFLEESTDKLLALIVIIAAIACIFCQLDIPEWYSMLVGMVGMFFFKRNNGDK